MTTDTRDEALSRSEKDATTGEIKQGVNVSPSMFYDNILMDKEDVPMKPMLLMTGGLPNSGKSRAIRQLLHLESDGSSKEGFACYNMMSIVSRHKQLDQSAIFGNSQLFYDLGFLAGLKTSFHYKFQTLSSFNENGPQSVLDDDDIHHRHRMNLKATWEKLMADDKSTEVQLLRSIYLGEAAALIKIWDVAFDSFSSQFLHCFSGHFYNNYMWLFTDIERDLPNLHFPLSKDDTQLIARRSRIQYLLNPSKLSSKLNGTRHAAVCTIFATMQKSKNYASQLQVIKLQEECKIAAPQIVSPDLIAENVIPLSSDRSDNKKILISQLYQIALKASQMIPLSHMFLRGSLELESSVFMRREDLKRKARLCGIDDGSFDEFCKSFTSFGSIIDVSLVSTSDIIIVKPDDFLTTLDRAFNFESLRNKDKMVTHGILTSDAALSLLGEDHQLYLEVLEAVGLATSVAEGQCTPLQGGICFYIPSLQRLLHGEEMYFNLDRVQLVTSMHFPSISLIVALTTHLLQTLPSSQLMLSMDRNKTIIQSPESEIEIVFHEGVIEFSVSEESFIKEIVKACKKLPYLLTNRYGETKFYFAVLCEKHDNYIGFNFYRKRHILPIDDKFDCGKCTCKLTESMKIWSSAINEVGLDEKFELDRLTEDDVIKLSTEISTYERLDVLAFIEALGQDRQLPEDQSHWKNELMKVINEWMLLPQGKSEEKPKIKESTKEKMAEILIELLTRTSVRSFEQLMARKLDIDIQTLTTEQIKELSRYSYQQDTADELKSEIQKREYEREVVVEASNSELLQKQIHETNSHSLPMRDKGETTVETVEQSQEHSTKSSIENSLPVVNNNVQFALDDVSKLMAILQPVEDDWYQLGYHLDMEESTLNDIKDNSTSQMEYLLQRWCSEGENTLTKLENALIAIGRKDLISELTSVTKIDFGKITPGDRPQLKKQEVYGLKIKVSKESQTQLTGKLHDSELIFFQSKGTTSLTIPKREKCKEYTIISAIFMLFLSLLLFSFLHKSSSNPILLPNVDIIASTRMIVLGGRSSQLNWDRYGLRLMTPHNALPSGFMAEIKIHVTLSGPYVYPDPNQWRLASAVYWLSSTKKFLAPVELGIYHNLNGKVVNSSVLRIIVANDEPQNMQYNFQYLNNSYYVNGSYCYISINHFSGFTSVSSEITSFRGSLLYRKSPKSNLIYGSIVS